MKQLPSSNEFRKELIRETVRFDIRKKALVILMILLGFLFMAILLNRSVVFKVTDDDMSPTLKEKDLLVKGKAKDLNSGDLVVLEYEGETIVRRIVAIEGDWVDFDRNGNVYVNNYVQEEEYLEEKALGICDIDLPYQVPQGQYFLLADERQDAVDSRRKEFGCFSIGELKGKILYRVWPLKDFGPMKTQTEADEANEES